MNLASPITHLPASVARHLYPVGGLHWIAGRLYRVSVHGEETEGSIGVFSTLVVHTNADQRRWVRDQITADLTALRTAILDERPVAFATHLEHLRVPILWVAHRHSGHFVEGIYIDLLEAIAHKPADAVGTINYLTAAVNAALE